MIRTTLTLLALAAPLAARDLQFGLPIDCSPGESCHVQNYVDRDPGPGTADVSCGPLTYDGHDGTDFALPTIAAMEAGVNVLAAAPGRVMRVRDGVEDMLLQGDATDVAGRECGNGLVIDHGDGWETQYCHLRQGSIIVEPGRRVRMGEVLGQVGLSGLTQFPHLHLTIRHDGVPVDPFDAANQQSCGGVPEPLWLEPVAYEPGGILSAGIAATVPEFEDLKAGLPQEPVGRTTPLVVWGLMFGGREGDLVELTITDPSGAAIVTTETKLERTQAQLFRAAGRRAPEDGWRPGGYLAAINLIREGEVVDSAIITFTLAP